MIVLFLKLYQKKDLCKKLLKAFKNINENQKDKNNMDVEPCLKEYTLKFNLIISEADKLINNNDYEIVEFYGIILCYLNYYDYDKFSSIVNELFNKKPKDLFEILLKYNAHFKNQLNQKELFFYKFINYAIENKDFQIFERGLNLIKDTKTYIAVIEKNKETFFNKYNSQKIDKVIRLDDLKFKYNEKFDLDEISPTKPFENYNTTSGGNVLTNTSEAKITEMEKIINRKVKQFNIINKKVKEPIFELLENIESIINFSKKKSTFLIYFTNKFWEYILNYYNEPKQDNILICSKLREIFIDYFYLVNKVIPENGQKFDIIRENAKTYFEKKKIEFFEKIEDISYLSLYLN